jgi:hypothetical protein
VPPVVRNLAQGFDPNVRRPESIRQAIEARVPGLTANIPPALDILGRSVQRPASQLGGANPFPWTAAKPDPVVNELARLNIATPQLPPASVKLGRNTIQLTDIERTQLLRQEQEQFFGRLQKIVAEPDWARKPDDAKRRIVQGLHARILEGRPRRVARLRDQRLSVTEALGSGDLAGRSLR